MDSVIIHSAIDASLSRLLATDAAARCCAITDLVLMLPICANIGFDIYHVLKSIPPIADKWPIREEQHRVLTKTDIVNTLPPHIDSIASDTVCPFCRDQHSEPLDLPCGHIYCKLCVETLIDYGHNQCGLCRRQYYKLNDVAPTTQLQQQASFAKRALTTHFKYWVLASVYLLTSSIHWHLLDSSSPRPIGCRIICVVDEVLCRTAYYWALQFVKRDLTYVEVFGEEWWTTLDSNEDLQWQEWFVGLSLQCGMIMAVTMFQLAGHWRW